MYLKIIELWISNWWDRSKLDGLPALIRLLNVPDSHCPGLVLRVGNANPLILGYHMILNGQNRLCVDSQPRNLCGKVDTNGRLISGSILNKCVDIYD